MRSPHTRSALALALVFALAACASDPAPVETQPVEEEPAPSPAPSVELVEMPADEAKQNPNVLGAFTGEFPAPEAAPSSNVYDRVISVPTSPDDDDAIRAAAKAATGAEVIETRRLSLRGGERVYVLLVFAPSDPPRGEAEQKALVSKVRASEAFSHADPDKIMTMKGASDAP